MLAGGHAHQVDVGRHVPHFRRQQERERFGGRTGLELEGSKIARVLSDLDRVTSVEPKALRDTVRDSLENNFPRFGDWGGKDGNRAVVAVTIADRNFDALRGLAVALAQTHDGRALPAKSLWIGGRVVKIDPTRLVGGQMEFHVFVVPARIDWLLYRPRNGFDFRLGVRRGRDPVMARVQIGNSQWSPQWQVHAIGGP